MNWTTADEALKTVRSGMRLFVGSGCAAPQKLVAALAARGADVFDVEIIHILTFAGAPYATRELLANFRHNAFFIGPNVRDAVNEGVADYSQRDSGAVSTEAGSPRSGADPGDSARRAWLLQLRRLGGCGESGGRERRLRRSRSESSHAAHPGRQFRACIRAGRHGRKRPAHPGIPK